jgi:multiple sugar transport system permease protein
MKSDWSRLVILLLFLWKNLGYNMVLFLSALNNVPTELIDSAKMDGAGSVRRFFSVSTVYILPTVFFVGMMSLVNSFKIFREVYLLTGSYPVDALYLLQHFMNNAFQNLDSQEAFVGSYYHVYCHDYYCWYSFPRGEPAGQRGRRIMKKNNGTQSGDDLL